jgi:MEDS: MEthanogen/methylotroph, DcmR Sensory domain
VFRPGEHACCRFAQAADRERLAVEFVREGLRQSDKVVYIADSNDPASICGRLHRLDPGFGPAIARGQLEVRDAHGTYLPDGTFDPDRMLGLVRAEHERVLADGYPGLSITGEMPVALCEAPAAGQLAVYESRLTKDHQPGAQLNPVSFLCQYDHARLAAEIMAEVVAAHHVDASPELAAIGRDGPVVAVRDRARDVLRLAGWLDLSCAPAVSEVIDAHVDGPLRLDLADLSLSTSPGCGHYAGAGDGR